MWLYQNLAVLCQHKLFVITCTFRHPVGIVGSWQRTRSVCIIITICIVVIIVTFILGCITFAIFDTHMQFSVCILIGTIHITDITATENIAITFGYTFGSTYFTAINVHLSLSEDETIGIERTAITHIIIAAASTEHITVNMAEV